VCGKQFTPVNGHQEYCKPSHASAARQQRRKGLPLHVIGIVRRTCPVCHKRFKPKVLNQKYCSKTCRQAKINANYYRARRADLLASIPERSCPVCGNPFIPKSFRQKYCSRQCSRDLANAKAKQKLQRERLAVQGQDDDIP